MYNLETLWNSLKVKGLYKNFANYAEYQKAQRAKGIVSLKENPKVGMMNPQLTQLKADARAPDEAHGLNEEIDVSQIPF